MLLILWWPRFFSGYIIQS